jgi:predicted DNA-binding transcriptional regulator AlpA
MADRTRREWLSPAQLSEELDLPLNTIYEWNRKGIGPPRHRFGRYVRYRRADIDRWTAEHQVPEAR